ncbi:MAG TPA: glycosyltransferase family 39 protein [Candidatus Methylomirabilis sp.]|nr:glycosyltransferase family 39 protein [Candidatus Methylomirabilis sp.]
MDLKRIGLYAAILAGVVVPLYALDVGGWTLLTNDEARFPAMARDIVARGHWLAPAIAGTPMLNKPPLHAWLIALASLPGGAVTPRTAALPSILGALGIVLGSAWLGARLFTPPAGLTAGLLAATTVGLFSLAHVPLPDTTLTLAITGAMCAFVLAELEGRRGALVVFYGATGLAFLAKGPVGLIPLAVGLVYELKSHGRSGVRRLLSLPGLLLLGLLTVPWLVLALHTGGHGFVRDVLDQDFRSTYFGSGARQWQRVAHPVKLAVEHLVPWVVLVPLAVWAALREPDRERARRLQLPIIWAATAFLLIAISERQRWRYYLPLVPPAALLVAAWFHGLRVRRATAMVATACLALVVVALAVGGRYEAQKRQRLTAVHDVVQELKSVPAPAFAIDSPDIVFDYYADRPVIPLTEYGSFERAPAPAYLIASETVASRAPASLDRLAIEARVNGKKFVLLKK